MAFTNLVGTKGLKGEKKYLFIFLIGERNFQTMFFKHVDLYVNDYSAFKFVFLFTLNY